jgi:glycosyltransferase involved in cell wall biosynthesis
MEQGIQSAKNQGLSPDYFLFTDADIEHHSTNLKELVTKAENENLALTSLMVLLRCDSFWEKFLIPAFVFFFQKLYPFPWVNNPQNKITKVVNTTIDSAEHTALIVKTLLNAHACFLVTFLNQIVT